MSSRDGRRPRITCAVLVSLLIFSVVNAFATTTCTFITQGKTMRLKADCTTDATIKIPQDFTLDGAGHTITAVDPGVGHFLGAVVSNAGTRANVFNLTIKAENLQDLPCDFGPGLTGDDRLRGIAFYGASGLITHNRIIGLNQGQGSTCNEGTGILAQNLPLDGTHPSTTQVSILDNEIVDAQTFGVAVQGDISAIVSGNRIGLFDGLGTLLPPLFPLSQSGIIIAYGGKGTAVLNKIQGGYTDGKGFDTYGVYIFEASNSNVLSNAISGVKDGVRVESQGFRVAGANDNRIQANLITGAYEAILLFSHSTVSSTLDPHVDHNIVGFNIIKSKDGTTPLTGIYYGGRQENLSYFPVADGNVIKSNVISGYINSIFDGGGTTKTVVTGNVIKP